MLLGQLWLGQLLWLDLAHECTPGPGGGPRNGPGEEVVRDDDAAVWGSRGAVEAVGGRGYWGGTELELAHTSDDRACLRTSEERRGVCPPAT
mmetsp:Transcript_39917/g.54388  ORF Transcript_39917/g.54388 Transcript_39917/m.54388 type:complete len:92 (-) Transcript_39917:121-396(-)